MQSPVQAAYAMRPKQTPELVLAARLRAFMRSSRQLNTLQRVAEHAGISERTVSNILAGSHSCTLAQVGKLADAFGVEPWQMLSPVVITAMEAA